MNYRHAFHAGNVGDVLKHVVLLELLAALRAKPSPMHLLDTHAGIGLYDLAGNEAQRSGEYRAGVGAVLADPAAATILPRYWQALRDLNPALKPGGTGLLAYPGSPWLLQQALRENDRLTLCELHPQDAAALKRNIGRDARVAIHHRDGFEALRALTPPTPRRGLALVDPAYELKDEFATLTAAVQAAHARWPTGMLAVWYPVKDRKDTDRWKGELARGIAAETIAVELTVRPARDERQMNGSGLVLVNPPWQFAASLAAPLDFLKARLMRESGAAAGVTTLVKGT